MKAWWDLQSQKIKDLGKGADTLTDAVMQHCFCSKHLSRGRGGGLPGLCLLDGV